MKTALLILLVTCLAQQTIAQPKGSGLLKQRLIAQAEYITDNFSGPCCILYLADSTILKYSGSRHSEFDYNIMDYIDWETISQGDQSYNTRASILIEPNNIDSTNYALRIGYDSLYYFDVGWNGQNALARIEECKYASDGKLEETSCLSYDLHEQNRFGYLVDDLINVYSKTDRYWWGDSTSRFLIRDLWGNVIVDSLVSYSNGQFYSKGAVFYSYNYPRQYVTRTTGWGIYAFSYRPDGRVLSQITLGDTGTGQYAPIDVDSFYYTQGIPGYTRHVHWLYQPPGVLSNVGYQYNFHVNALGQKDTMTYSTTDLTDTQVVYLTYNGQGNPETRTWEHYTNGVLDDRKKKIYHYEDYDPTLGVQNAIPTTLTTLSPNPTSGTITLHYNSALPKAPIRVVISNMMGQLVHSEAFFPQGSSTNVTLGDEAAPGIYSIYVYGEGSSMLYKSIFVKR